MWFVFLNQIFSIIEVVLGSHTLVHCSRSHWSFSIGSLRSSLSFVLEIIEIIEHQIHIVLFFVLKMMYNPLIFVNFNSNVCISLSWNSSWFYKIIIIQIVASLCCRNLRNHSHLLMTIITFHLGSVIKRFLLFPSNRIIIKVPTLFL